MSGLAQGIHVFYPTSASAVGYAYYDGNTWSGGSKPLQVIPAPGPAGWETWGKYVQHIPIYPPSIQSGVASILHEGAAYIFATGSDNGLYVSVFYGGDNNLHYIGQVPNVATTDVVSLLKSDGNIVVYYKDAGGTNNGGPATTTVHLSGQSLSPVSGPQAIVVPYQPTSWGPTALVRGGAVNLIYGDNSNALRAVWQTQANTWESMDPSGAFLHWSPAAILVDDNIFALYHGQDTRALYVDVAAEDTVWTQSVANQGNDSSQEMIVGGGPGLCLYGGRLFALFQGQGNQLYCQVYMGKQWLAQPILVADSTNSALVSDLWFGPSPIAVEAA